VPSKSAKLWAAAQQTASPARRPQVAALCLRGSGEDLRVLMITSRGTGRWIIPKGWPIPGKTGAQAAMTEAWEEAGVKKAKINPDPIGSYGYDKITDDGGAIPVQAQVYVLTVEKLVDDFPEADERKRKWMRPKRAAKLVAEPELRDILRAL
jgi:8-oxo-dGTP pyrophosphatase MutT (NUDIX family)